MAIEDVSILKYILVLFYNFCACFLNGNIRTRLRGWSMVPPVYFLKLHRCITKKNGRGKFDYSGHFFYPEDNR